MRNSRGLIVQHKTGKNFDYKSVPIVLDDGYIDKLFRPPEEVYNHEKLEDFQRAYIEFLRGSYNNYKELFSYYAQGYKNKQFHLHCSCKNKKHCERCLVPIVEKVFCKINNL